MQATATARAAATPRPTRRRVQALRVATTVLSYTLLLIGAAAMAIPFLWIISTSLKEEGRVFSFPPQWVPNPVTFQAYLDVFTLFPFGRFTLNSTLISVTATFGGLLSASLGAFAFARLRFPGRDKLFLVLLATMMIPGQVTLIPVFILFSKIGWVGTFAPLIIPSFFGGAFGTFLLRQFFLTIPGELVDAAKIDGANTLQIFYKVFLPLCKPALATLGVFAFMGHWNDLFGPVIYLQDKEKYTLMIGLAYFRWQYGVQWARLMAGTLISLIPIIAGFMVAQKYFVQGVVISGIKG